MEKPGGDGSFLNKTESSCSENGIKKMSVEVRHRSRTGTFQRNCVIIAWNPESQICVQKSVIQDIAKV